MISASVDKASEGVIQSAPALEGYLLTAMSDADRDVEVSQDKARGTMFGLAVGNLLGLDVEGFWREDIESLHPNGVTEIDRRERLRPMDDDLAQAVELAECLVNGEDLIHDLARRFVDWYDMNGRGCGITTLSVIELLRTKPPFESAREVYEARNKIAPNGAVMRCAPVGIVNSTDPGRLVQQSAATAAVTHYAPTCQWSCILTNSVIVLMLCGMLPDLTAIYRAAKEDGLPDLVTQAESDGIPAQVLNAVASGETVPADMEWLRASHHMIGHTLLALQVGLWAAETQLGFEDALVEVVSSGGDTDTNGAVAGAVLGARYGKDAMPERWLECVPQSERIGKLADELIYGKP